MIIDQQILLIHVYSKYQYVLTEFVNACTLIQLTGVYDASFDIWERGMAERKCDYLGLGGRARCSNSLRGTVHADSIDTSWFAQSEPEHNALLNVIHCGQVCYALLYLHIALCHYYTFGNYLGFI